MCDTPLDTADQGASDAAEIRCPLLPESIYEDHDLNPAFSWVKASRERREILTAMVRSDCNAQIFVKG